MNAARNILRSNNAQVSLFAMVVYLTVIVVDLSFDLRQQTIESDLTKAKNSLVDSEFDKDFLNSYRNNCLQQTAQKAIVLVSFQGGFTNTTKDPSHGQYDDILSVSFNGFSVPVYVDGTSKTYPSNESIEQNIERYIAAEFAN